MNIDTIQECGAVVISLLQQYAAGPDRERQVDPVLFGCLTARFGRISRQHPVYLYGSERPQRIDFRYGGPNPVVIEFAVRPRDGGGQLYGSQNESELRKLTRVNQTEAKLRVLLLVDLANAPIAESELKPTYDGINAGPGNFTRMPVRIIYVHDKQSYNFIWRPNA